jgi:hypothetical protein
VTVVTDACPDCDGVLVPFAVPESLRAYAPDESTAATICADCLRVDAADGVRIGVADEGPSNPDFSPVLEAFPDGEGGVALALLVGKLPSLTLEREAVETLRDRAERAGVDVTLTLDRLVAAGGVDPSFDLQRRVAQMEQLV